MKRIIALVSIALVLVLSGIVYYKYYFPFGEGVISGELNYMVHKGILFKTYEGKLIQSGFRSTGASAGAAIQSYEFEFSVKNKEIAEKLMLSSGRDMELRYVEYKGTLPWRGFSKYVVTEIVSINGQKSNPQATLPVK